MSIATRIAYRALELINEQIEAGKDIDGKAYKYSEKPFFRPYSKSLVAKLGGKAKKGVLYSTVKRQGKMGMIVLQGYKSIREAYGRATDDDFLQFTGNMLAAMDIIKVEANSATIGFTNPRMAQIAFWLNVSGAGKSRKLWKFFGLTKESQDKLAETLKELQQADLDELTEFVDLGKFFK